MQREMNKALEVIRKYNGEPSVDPRKYPQREGETEIFPDRIQGREADTTIVDDLGSADVNLDTFKALYGALTSGRSFKTIEEMRAEIGLVPIGKDLLDKSVRAVVGPLKESTQKDLKERFKNDAEM